KLAIVPSLSVVHCEAVPMSRSRTVPRMPDMALAYRPTPAPLPVRALSLGVTRIVASSFVVYLHRWRAHLAASIIAQGPVFAATIFVVERVVESTRVAATRPSADAVGPAAGLSFLLLFLAFAG